MKKIAAVMLAAGMAAGAQADIVRLDLFGFGTLGSQDWVPFRAYVAVNTERQERLIAEGGQTNGFFGAPNMYSLGIRFGQTRCAAGFAVHQTGSGVSFGPTTLGLNAYPLPWLLVNDCNITLSYVADPPLALSLSDTLPPYSGPLGIFGSGLVDGEIFNVLELTGYVYRVNGYVVAATNPFLIPEPATAALFGAGLIGLIGWRRKTA